MRSPHAAHSRNGSVITHRAASRCLQRIASTLRRVRCSPSVKSTRLLWTTTEAIRQRARHHREDAPTRASPSDRPPQATPAFTSYPASRRPIPPHDHGALQRRQAPPPLQDTPCSRDRRPQTADGRQRKARQRTVPPKPPGPALETPANPALECPSPRRRKNTAHASAGRFLFSNPRRDAPPRESRWLDLRVEVFGRDAGPHNPSEE